MKTLVLKIFVHEGGKLPQRGKQGDAGIDVFARLPEQEQHWEIVNGEKRWLGKHVKQFDDVKIPLGFSYSFWEKHAGRDPFTGEADAALYGPIHDYYLEVDNRSGVGTKSGMVPVARIGDANYRGELHYCAVKVKAGEYVIKHGDKIAQCLISPFVDPHRVEIVQVDKIEDLGPSDRGATGFGDSGR